MSKNIDYGQQIKEMLIEKGLEQKELAQELGTSYTIAMYQRMAM